MKQKLWITLVGCIAYCINKELYKAIDYLREQVRVLIEQQEKQNKRILLTNRQRIRVAAKAKRLSRKMLEQCTELFTADTVMHWYNKLIAEKYDSSGKRGKIGRPQITAEIVILVIKFKRENPRWGYQKITDQIEYLGYKISKTSVKNILIENGYDPEPDLTVRSTRRGSNPSMKPGFASFNFKKYYFYITPSLLAFYSHLQDRFSLLSGILCEPFWYSFDAQTIKIIRPVHSQPLAQVRQV